MTKTVEWGLYTPETNENWCYIDNVLNAATCNHIKNIAKHDLNMGLVANDNDGTSINSKDIRNSWIHVLDSSNADLEHIYRACTTHVLGANEQFWQYKIEKLESLQYGEYREDDDGGHFSKHVDALRVVANHNGYRKLSFSIQLSDPNEYEGGELLLHYGPSPVPANKEQGTMIIFPSTMLHEVTPVTRGVRRSLVGWVLGPKLK